jgi:hypothetical protein
VDPIDPACRPALLIAHPGHELRVLGWLRHAKPRVFVLTDGSGHGESRLENTSALLESAGASTSTSLSGRLTDHQLYTAILECDMDLFESLVDSIAAELAEQRIGAIVVDAAEGYNPVHDLCRLLAGAACSLAALKGVLVKQYEFSVVGGPDSFERNTHVAYELSGDELDQKLSTARSFIPLRDDIDELLARFGAEAFRRERFRRVDDWQLPDREAPPLYEQIGDDRVRDGRYTRVIRYAEHMLPLQRRLLQLVEKHSCVS